MEVRYIVFTPEESRHAIVAFVLRQGTAVSANDIADVMLVGDQDDPCATVQLRSPLLAEPVTLTAQYLTAALLLYCGEHRIQIPMRALKAVEHSLHGLTLVLTTDADQGVPVAAGNHVTYGTIANRATREILTVKEELARAQLRADHAERLIAEADAGTRRVDAARAKSATQLIRIGEVRGLRGRIGLAGALQGPAFGGLGLTRYLQAAAAPALHRTQAQAQCVQFDEALGVELVVGALVFLERHHVLRIQAVGGLAADHADIAFV